MADRQGPSSRDAQAANSARIYDYLLGGKDSYAVDRAAARQLLEVFPEARRLARANRRFLVQAVSYLAGLGIEQFIDLGTGFPTSPNVDEVARETVPEARVAYVDNDQVVTVHNRALRAAPGVIAIEGDIRHPDKILFDPDLRLLIDFTRPVAVLFVAVLHFIRPEEDPAGIVAAFRDQMATGSYLVISHGVSDGTDPQTLAQITSTYSKASAPAVARRIGEVAAWFDGFALVRPGLADVTCWQAGWSPRPGPIRVVAVVGRKRGR